MVIFPRRQTLSENYQFLTTRRQGYGCFCMSEIECSLVSNSKLKKRRDCLKEIHHWEADYALFYENEQKDKTEDDRRLLGNNMKQKIVIHLLWILSTDFHTILPLKVSFFSSQVESLCLNIHCHDNDVRRQISPRKEPPRNYGHQ